MQNLPLNMVAFITLTQVNDLKQLCRKINPSIK